MSEDRNVTITLTDWQVARVVESSAASVLAALPEGLAEFGQLQGAVLPLLDDTAFSRSTLRALLVLGAFPADGGERELTDVARELDLSPSTTHRYIGTWMAVGLLEQHPRSRRYRRAAVAAKVAST
ncbi:MAG: helix-turn-helix domain-containing protein [Solirubrobacteraceae bacterium]